MVKEYLYLDSTVPLEDRVNDLIQQMTLEEKIAQLGSVQFSDLLENGRFSAEKGKVFLKNGIGQITRIAGTRVLEIKPDEVAETANNIQNFLLKETRLKIPTIIHEECLSGLMGYGATIFPQAIGLASSWNFELVEKVSTIIKTQMRAIGSHQGLSPVLDVARDPRWGRTEETFGEDPYLVANLGTAYIRGLQGNSIKTGIIATPKHFAAHGFSEGGRNCAPVHVPQRELREVFLFPFEAAIKIAKAESLMNAYHEIDGIPCAASYELLTQILRKEWGFKGYVVSDYTAVEMLYTFHKVAVNEMEAAVQALEAGIDIELPNTKCYGQPLLQAVKEGILLESVLNQAVARILRSKFLLGIFEDPFIDKDKVSEIFDNSEQRVTSLKAARESIVLLKNNGILPLSKDISSICIIGPTSDSRRNLLGDYTYEAHLNRSQSIKVISPLEGIKSKISKSTMIYQNIGCDLIGDSLEEWDKVREITSKSSIIIAVLGEKSGVFSEDSTTGEGRDRTSLALTGVQKDLLEVLFKTEKPVVLILVNGRPLSLEGIAERCSAIVEAWFPGEEGGNAIADILFGDYNPSGKLPISFPYEVGQIPVYYNRKPSSFRTYVTKDAKALFPFGHGLSYTNFEYSSLNITPSDIAPAGTLEISFKIKNIGDRTGEEVVQLYLQDSVASLSRPIKELKGFKKISLESREERTVIFKLSTDQLAFYDRYMRLIVEPGLFNVMIGSSSEDIRLQGAFRVVGNVRVVPSDRTLFTEVKVR